MRKKIKKESSKNLFSEFNPVTREKWEDLINKDLGISDYKEELKWDTDEGVTILPFYMHEDAGNPSVPYTEPGAYPLAKRGQEKNEWAITENITSPSIEESNRLALEAVEMGAGSLYVFQDAAPNEGMLGGDIRGIPLLEQKDMRNLLEGVDLKSVSVYFDGGIITPLIYFMFMNEVERQQLDPADLKVLFYYDPFSWGAAHGRWPNTEERTSEIITELCDSPFPVLGVNGTFYHNCGATIVQELGIALAIGSEFLALADRNDVPLSKAARSVHMRLSAGPLYFPEIAKFRAARLLWNKVVSAYDPAAADDAGLFIHAETSSWNKTITDPHINILRTATEAMSAITGGADSLRVDPFDNRFRQASSPARRIARNIHHILRHESNFHRVSDPSGGSYYIEQLTDKIASESWDFFQFLEKQGGFTKALEGRFLQLAIEESIRKKQDAIKQGKRVFVGVNRYPNPGDQIPDKLYQELPVHSLLQTPKAGPQDGTLAEIRNVFNNGAKIGDTIDAVFQVQKQLYPSLESWHAADPYESLRIKTIEYQKKNGREPIVVILTTENNKESKFRTALSANIFDIVGYKIHNCNGFETIEDAADEINSLKPDIIVLCSTDEAYPKLIEPFCRTFRPPEDNNPILILAARPEENTEKYRESGIDYFIYHGSEIYETLESIHAKLED